MENAAPQGMAVDMQIVQATLGEQQLTIMALKSELTRIQRELAQAQAKIKSLTPKDESPAE